METDVIKFFKLKRKPKAGELYLNENGNLYRCNDPEKNDNELGWPGEVTTVIPLLEKTALDLYELEDLRNVVWKNRLKEGDFIHIKKQFTV